MNNVILMLMCYIMQIISFFYFLLIYVNMPIRNTMIDFKRRFKLLNVLDVIVFLFGIGGFALFIISLIIMEFLFFIYDQLEKLTKIRIFKDK